MKGRSRNAARIDDASIAVVLLLFAAVWLTALDATNLSPPVDNIEQLTWVRSLEWGYYKHPPLPTWLIWLPVKLFGLSAWTSYSCGALVTLTAIWVFWRLLLVLRGRTYARVALLAVLCITYYNNRLFYYNHNSVLLLCSALTATFTWKAFETRRLRWWWGLGLMLGFGALTKYQIAVTATSAVVFMVRQRAWREPLHRRGAALAALAALLVVAPHLVWLRSHGLGPIRYAFESSLGARLGAVERLTGSFHWLADQLLNRLFPALLLLALVVHSQRRRRADVAPSAAMTTCAGRELLLSFGVVPLLFIPIVCLATGAELQLQWGTPFLMFAVPAIMELVRFGSWHLVPLQRVLRPFMVIQALLLGLNFVTSPRGPAIARDHHRAAFDSAALVRLVAPHARAELGGPIRVVSGPTSDAGALALALPEHPVLLIDGRFDNSPWVDPDLVRRCGVVIVAPAASVPGGIPVGDPFAGLAWRVDKPKAMELGCRNAR
ncbi:MAG: glycosyltransferase family 39 protein [Pseudomonadota bacterium]|nr:glycosyltransferase family 39 protein [Pseudomonadota bacterium]